MRRCKHCLARIFWLYISRGWVHWQTDMDGKCCSGFHTEPIDLGLLVLTEERREERGLGTV